METILDSRFGKLFVIAYTLITLCTYVVSYSCGGDECGLYIVVPILPWAWILTNEFGLSFPWAVYPILILLNASMAYILGAGIEQIYIRWRDRNVKDVNFLSTTDKVEL